MYSLMSIRERTSGARCAPRKGEAVRLKPGNFPNTSVMCFPAGTRKLCGIFAGMWTMSLLSPLLERRAPVANDGH
jgi:hypothetical protein